MANIQAEEKEKNKAEAAKKEAAQKRQKFAPIFSYADAAKKNHPEIPPDLMSKIQACTTKGEAKRLVKDFLVAQSQPARV